MKRFVSRLWLLAQAAILVGVIVWLTLLPLRVSPYQSVTTFAQALMSDFAWSATGKLLMSGTAPTIASGFGNTPSIGTNNGVESFLVYVGTGGTAWNGTIGMPAATNRWNCHIQAPTPGQTTKQSFLSGAAGGATTTNVLIWNYGTGLLTTPWNSSDMLIVSCFGT